ncbi:MAG: gas vesicle protein GvpL [Halobacteria archaeon]
MGQKSNELCGSGNRSSEDQEPLGDGGIEEYRYLYCLFSLGGDCSIEKEGVDGEKVYCISVGDLTAAVHTCDGIYDTDDRDKVREWLFRHQYVIDSVGEEYGTPIPFRFDTLIEGGDEQVEEWISENYDDLEDILEQYNGRWEYRAQLYWNVDELDRELIDSNPELSDLRKEIESGGSGRSFLLEKKLKAKLKDYRAEKGKEFMDGIKDDVEDNVVEIEESKPTGENTAEGEKKHVGSLVILMEKGAEEQVGEVLDEVAARPGVEIKYTGPWPPYSFISEVIDQNGTR